MTRAYDRPLCPLCNDTGEQRYWEGRWRDEHASNKDLAMFNAALEKALSSEIDRLRALNAELLASLEGMLMEWDKLSRYGSCREIDRFHASNKELVELLEWLNNKGGLGLGVHERIRAAIAKAKQGL